MSAIQIIALVILGILYLAFCAYWWRGGRPVSNARDPRGDQDRV